MTVEDVIAKFDSWRYKTVPLNDMRTTPGLGRAVLLSLTRNDKDYFIHLAIWPRKSNLTPYFKKLCDVTVECGEGGGGAQSLSNGQYTKKILISAAHFV